MELFPKRFGKTLYSKTSFSELVNYFSILPIWCKQILGGYIMWVKHGNASPIHLVNNVKNAVLNIAEAL